MDNIPAWQLTKVRDKKKVIDEARIQEQTEKERVVSKLRPAAMDLSSSIATWLPIASGKPDSRMSIEPNSFDAAST